MIKIFADAEQLNRFAAEKFVEIADASINSTGRFTVALSGGSTPKSLFQLLASDEYKNKIDWSKVVFFFGDERNVAPDDKDSNFRMANETFFNPLHIAASNIYSWETELNDTERTAFNYEFRIKNIFGTVPRFDLILLGMGDDGHTASLFPFTEALRETERYAIVNLVEKLDTTRFTMTFPVINNARNVIILVKGSDKAKALREVLQGESAPETFPAQRVNPANGEMLWLVDASAAALLDA